MLDYFMQYSIGTFIVVVGLVLFIVKRYVTVGSHVALIVTGSGLKGSHVVETDKGRKVKIVSGGGTLVWPIIQQAHSLSLATYNLSVNASNVYTKQKVRLGASCVAMVKVGSDNKMIATAAEQFLGKSEDEIAREVTEVLEGHLRAILGSLTIEDAYSNREEFSRKVKEVADGDLTKMGFEMVSFSVKDYIDVDKYLEYQSQHRISEVAKDAQIAKARADKEARIESALAEQEARKAELERASEISEAEKENAIRMANYKMEQDKAKAEADAAYDIQKAISAQKVKEEQMKIEIIEREKQIELQEKESERQKRQYNAEINMKADADAYATEKKAQAEKIKRQLESDALKYSIEAESEAKANEIKLAGLAQSEAEKAKGLAAAEVVKENGLAEAIAKEKLAEAYKKFGEAAVLEMLLNTLPLIAKEISAPLQNVESIKIIDTGSGKGVGNISGNVVNMMTTVQETLKETTGIDLKELVENFSGKHNIKGELGLIAENLSKEVEVVEESKNETKQEIKQENGIEKE